MFLNPSDFKPFLSIDEIFPTFRSKIAKNFAKFSRMNQNQFPRFSGKVEFREFWVNFQENRIFGVLEIEFSSLKYLNFEVGVLD